MSLTFETIRPMNYRESPVASHHRDASRRLNAIGPFIDRTSIKERKVIYRLFGLDGGAPNTIQEVASRYGVAPSDIQRYRQRGLRKIAKGAGLPDAEAVAAIFESWNHWSRLHHHGIQCTGEVIERVRTLTPELIKHLKTHSDDLQKLPPNVFEHVIAEFLSSQGFQHIALLGRNSESAADIFAAYYLPGLSSPIRVFIEVKRWKNRVGIEVVDRVLGAMLSERPTHGWHAAMIVTLAAISSFRRTTKSSLTNIGLELKSREDILRWLHDYEQHPSGLWIPTPPTSIAEAMSRNPIDVMHERMARGIG